MKKPTAKKMALLGFFSAIAVIFGYIESLFPLFAGIPGIKPGFANLCILFTLYKYSFREAAFVSIVRILIIGFMFGNLFSILYSLAGTALSLTAMTLLKKYTSFSPYGISVAGGVTHNIGQLLIAIIIVNNRHLLFYAPFLMISGMAAGLIIGLLTTEVQKRIH